MIPDAILWPFVAVCLVLDVVLFREFAATYAASVGRRRGT